MSFTTGSNQTIYGTLSNDVLYGYSGNDTMYGGAGNDTLYGGTDNDKLHGEDGNDQLYGDSGDDDLAGNIGNDTIYGGDGNDHVTGGDGNDWLFGNNGNDYLVGNNGNDVMTGGTGNDYFKISSYDDGIDTIKDFKNGIMTLNRSTWNLETDSIIIYITEDDIDQIISDGIFGNAATEAQKQHIIDNILITEQVGNDLQFRMGNTGGVLDTNVFATFEGLGNVSKEALNISIETNLGNPNGYSSWGF